MIIYDNWSPEKKTGYKIYPVCETQLDGLFIIDFYVYESIKQQIRYRKRLVADNLSVAMGTACKIEQDEFEELINISFFDSKPINDEPNSTASTVESVVLTQGRGEESDYQALVTYLSNGNSFIQSGFLREKMDVITPIFTKNKMTQLGLELFENGYNPDF